MNTPTPRPHPENTPRALTPQHPTPYMWGVGEWGAGGVIAHPANSNAGNALAFGASIGYNQRGLGRMVWRGPDGVRRRRVNRRASR